MGPSSWAGTPPAGCEKTPVESGCRLTFDRGTILVQPGREGDAATLDGIECLVRDPRVGAWRTTAHRYREVRDRMLDSGLACDDRVPAWGRSGAAGPEWSSGTATGGGGPDLRVYQSEALAAWEAAGRRGVVALPTGSGKTVVALAAIARVGCPAVILVPTRVLLDQWAARARDVLGVEPGRVGDGERVLGWVTVCTFESAWRYMDEFGDRFALVVVDEAHHFGAGVRAEALETCAAPWRLGLTGTPPDAPEAEDRLADLVGPVVYRLWVRDLAGTYLAPLRRLVRGIDLDPQERVAYDQAFSPFVAALRAFRHANPDATWREFLRASLATADGRRMLAGRRAARRVVSTAAGKVRALADLLRRHPEERVIAFTADNAAAYAVSRALLVPAMTCDIGRAERERILEAFRDGAVRALVSARVLNEGVDVPSASVGVVLGGSQGGREHAQRIGRLLRPAPGKTALLVEVFARSTFEDREPSRRMRGVLFPEEDSG